MKHMLQKLDENRYLIPKSYRKDMRTDGLIFTNEAMLEGDFDFNALNQVVNVSTLPGIVGKSFAMPDIHWGYGFPIGGVAATDADEGVISPGGVGFDINCGVRLLRTNLMKNDIAGKIRELVDTLFVSVPSGLGSSLKKKYSMGELDDILLNGAKWAVESGFGWKEDLEFTEENGRMEGASAYVVSTKAKQRGLDKAGTLGAGNHFLEIQYVDKIYDPQAATTFGIERENQVVVMIHTGSRSVGHQVCQDSLQLFASAVKRYNIDLPDRQLNCAPLNSREAQNYLKGMKASANFAWANRQVIAHQVRRSFEKVLKRSAEEMEMSQVYDVAHNIAKEEVHEIEGNKRNVIVHRKGATRAFGPGKIEVPLRYRTVGQPVLIPGDMGSASFLLKGTDAAMKESFGSTCHGAGRVLSRKEAVRRFMKRNIQNEMLEKGIYVHAYAKRVLAEEFPSAYKNVQNVVDVAHGAGISLRVARFRPMGVVKG